MNPQPQEKLLYRVSTAAEILDISRSQAYKLINLQILESVRVGNSVRVPAEAVRRMAAGGPARRIQC
jgi:excisionase family DNA binding protein